MTILEKGKVTGITKMSQNPIPVKAARTMTGMGKAESNRHLAGKVTKAMTDLGTMVKAMESLTSQVGVEEKDTMEAMATMITKFIKPKVAKINHGKVKEAIIRDRMIKGRSTSHRTSQRRIKNLPSLRARELRLFGKCIEVVEGRGALLGISQSPKWQQTSGRCCKTSVRCGSHG